jgi:hypothetical protein
VDDLPVKAETCDATAEETAFTEAATAADRQQQFFDWCNANPGDVTMGLCGPEM